LKEPVEIEGSVVNSQLVVVAASAANKSFGPAEGMGWMAMPVSMRLLMSAHRRVVCVIGVGGAGDAESVETFGLWS